jgi:hypothetical protein
MHKTINSGECIDFRHKYELASSLLPNSGSYAFYIAIKKRISIFHDKGTNQINSVSNKTQMYTFACITVFTLIFKIFTYMKLEFRIRIDYKRIQIQPFKTNADPDPGK